jgi:hypothetical protein
MESPSMARRMVMPADYPLVRCVKHAGWEWTFSAPDYVCTS